MEQTPKFTHDQGGSATWHFRPTESGPAQTLSTKELRAHSEGPRANSTRFTVYLKYLGFFMVTVLAAVITNGLLVTAGTTSYGGALMWFSACVMYVTAALGTVLFPQNRTEIIAQMRHYVFGLSLFPGVAIASIIWALQDVMSTPTAGNDVLATLINFAVPAVFITTVVLPPIIFIKAVAGYYSLRRSTGSDEDMIASFTRQDQGQR